MTTSVLLRLEDYAKEDLNLRIYTDYDITHRIYTMRINTRPEMMWRYDKELLEEMKRTNQYEMEF